MMYEHDTHIQIRSPRWKNTERMVFSRQNSAHPTANASARIVSTPLRNLHSQHFLRPNHFFVVFFFFLWAQRFFFLFFADSSIAHILRIEWLPRRLIWKKKWKRNGQIMIFVRFGFVSNRDAIKICIFWRHVASWPGFHVWCGNICQG